MKYSVKNRGSALLFLAAIAVILGIIGVAFNRQAGDSRYITRKQAKSMFLRSFAQAVAHFSLIKLQRELQQNHWLSSMFLNKPLTELQDFERSIDIVEFQPLLAPMIQALEKEGEFSYRIQVTALKNDFSPTHYSHVFPTEKSGLIRLKIITSLKGFTEEFAYVAPIKVTSPLLPALSKFNFYLHDAAPEGDDLFYNRVKNDFRGSIIGNARPIVFNNGPISALELDWQKLINQGVGLIFLGGGDVRLNLSSSTGSDISDFGESFHFFKRSKPRPESPFYLWKDQTDPPLVDAVKGSQPTLFLRYDHGLSTFGPDDPLRDISRQIFANASAQYPDGEKEYVMSSILRLFGTDRQVSPTLVLGRVYRGFVSVSAAKVIPPGYPRNELFIYPSDFSDFDNMLNRFDQSQVGRLLFPSPRTQQHLESFRNDYASGIAYQPYNLSMAFIATRNQHAGPLGEVERISQPLARCMSHNSQGLLTNPEATDLPEKLAALAGKVKPEKLLEIFSEPAMQPDKSIASRFAWIIDLENSSNPDCLLQKLQAIGLYNNNQLRLNGWAYVINAPEELFISQPVKLAGHGGMVIGSKTRLIVRSNIDGKKEDDSRMIFQLIVKDGDIVVDTGIIDASLITPAGQVQFRRKAEINGSLIMREFTPENNFPGADLNYNPNLSILPDNSRFNQNLTYALQTFPMLVNQ